MISIIKAFGLYLSTIKLVISDYYSVYYLRCNKAAVIVCIFLHINNSVDAALCDQIT